MTDKTAGRIPVVGWMGLGADSISMSNGDILSPTSIGNAFFSQGGGDKNNHFGGYGAGIHLSYGIGASGTQRMTANLFIDSAGNLSVEWLAVNISDGNVATQGIQKLYGPLNKPSAGDVGAIPFFGQIPAGTNLNTLTNHGVWFNPANANATLALNYPSTQAGSLQVLQDAGTTQIYTEYAGGRQFRRGLYTGTWSPWFVVYDSHNKPTSDDVNAIIRDGCHIAGFVSGDVAKPYMRHTATNDVVQLMTYDVASSIFVQGVQLGAAVSMQYYLEPTSVPSGCVITAMGAAGGDNVGTLKYKPIQRNINGVWATISG